MLWNYFIEIAWRISYKSSKIILLLVFQAAIIPSTTLTLPLPMTQHHIPIYPIPSHCRFLISIPMTIFHRPSSFKKKKKHKKRWGNKKEEIRHVILDQWRFVQGFQEVGDGDDGESDVCLNFFLIVVVVQGLSLLRMTPAW